MIYIHESFQLPFLCPDNALIEQEKGITGMKKFNARAVTLWDPEEQMVIGTLMFSHSDKLAWMPSNDILMFDGDGYISDAGYTVYVTVVGEESKTGVRIYIDGQGFNAYVKAYTNEDE